ELPGIDRLHLELGFVEFDELGKTPRLGKQAPVRLEEIDRVFLGMDLRLQLAHQHLLRFGIRLDLVGRGSSRNHYGNEDDIGGSEHGMLPLARLRSAGKSGKAEGGKIGRTGRSVRTYCSAQASRAGTRIGSEFGFARRDIAAKLTKGEGLPPCLGQMPRAGRRLAAIGDEALYDPILKRMERHHCQTAAWLQHAFGPKQRPGQLAEFVIDVDAQRLEYPRGWMDTVPRLAPDTGFDRIGQVERTFERSPRPPLLDHARNPPGM